MGNRLLRRKRRMLHRAFRISSYNPQRLHMPFSAGTKLGTYEIVGPLGAGGMGEVYRAKDSKLKREVAIKVLPDAFAHDADRMARFAREACC